MYYICTFTVLRIELRAIPLANLEMGGVDVIELVIVL
jgi:hypothetical protein